MGFGAPAPLFGLVCTWTSHFAPLGLKNRVTVLKQFRRHQYKMEEALFARWIKDSYLHIIFSLVI